MSSGVPRPLHLTGHDRARLDDATYAVADEYRARRLQRLTRPLWHDTWQNLLEEVKAKCPGWSDAEYEGALEVGFRDSR